MAVDYRGYLLKRFPYLEKAIRAKLAASADFCMLCEDYVDAVEALTRWEDAPDLSSRTKAKVVEYRRLVENLEAEVLLELYRNPRI